MVLPTRTSAPNTSLAVIRPKPRPDSPTESEISVIMLKSELPHEAPNPVSKKTNGPGASGRPARRPCLSPPAVMIAMTPPMPAVIVAPIPRLDRLIGIGGLADDLAIGGRGHRRRCAGKGDARRRQRGDQDRTHVSSPRCSRGALAPPML